MLSAEGMGLFSSYLTISIWQMLIVLLYLHSECNAEKRPLIKQQLSFMEIKWLANQKPEQNHSGMTMAVCVHRNAGPKIAGSGDSTPVAGDRGTDTLAWLLPLISLNGTASGSGVWPGQPQASWVQGGTQCFPLVVKQCQAMFAYRHWTMAHTHLYNGGSQGKIFKYNNNYYKIKQCKVYGVIV